MRRTYKIVDGGSHTRFEDGQPVRYRRGDEIELTDEEAQGESLKGRVEVVETTTAAADPEPGPPAGAKVPEVKPAPVEPKAVEPKAEPDLEVDTDDGGDTDTTTGDTTVDGENLYLSALDSSTWQEAVDLVHSLDSADEVHELKAAEESRRRPRARVLKAADQRISELTE